MNGYGIPVAISENWDMPGKMSSSSGVGLGTIGRQVKANTDMLHGHPMPFYLNKSEAEAWPYIASQVRWYSENVGLPTFITEVGDCLRATLNVCLTSNFQTQWAWGTGGDHGSGVGDVGITQYSEYWHTFDDNCALFKQYQTGWFIHAWAMETTFDMIRDDGSYTIPAWKPKRCDNGATSLPTVTQSPSSAIGNELSKILSTTLSPILSHASTTEQESSSSSSRIETLFCSWPGHCQGANCKTYNDCADPFDCRRGICT